MLSPFFDMCPVKICTDDYNTSKLSKKIYNSVIHSISSGMCEWDSAKTTAFVSYDNFPPDFGDCNNGISFHVVFAILKSMFAGAGANMKISLGYVCDGAADIDKHNYLYRQCFFDKFVISAL